jgi:hypothetical protein
MAAPENTGAGNTGAETPSQALARAGSQDGAPAARPLTPAAQRALAEAAARRAERDQHPVEHPDELAGRGGPEPTRYGDWEINGLISDF